MDREKIEKAVRDILEAIGEDPDREGLRETPNRVARMYEEVKERPRFIISKVCGDEDNDTKNIG